MTAPLLASLQVSLPRHFGQEGAADPKDRPRTTGFFKERVNGPVHLRRTNLDGDGQADLVHHGGPEKAAHFEKLDIAAAVELAGIPLLSESWRTELTRRAGGFARP